MIAALTKNIRLWHFHFAVCENTYLYMPITTYENLDELCYTGGEGNAQSKRAFFLQVLKGLREKFSTVSMKADDIDPNAMLLQSVFSFSKTSFDTHIRPLQSETDLV